MYFMMLVSFLVLTSCSSKKKEASNYETSYVYHDGTMSIKYPKDSLHVQYITIYDSVEKQIVKKYKLINMLRNGLEEGYFKSGNLKFKRYYLNDTLEGKSILYYDSSSKK